MEIIFHGFMLALGLILPLGVQNVFVFTQGATQKSFLFALPATITAAICDTILILLAVSGLSLLLIQMEQVRIFVMIGGILFLIYMSISIWRSTPTSTTQGEAFSIKKQILFACSVSLLNPSALIDIFAVIGTSSLRYSDYDLVLFTISCITVSWIWFFTLTFSGSKLKKLPNQQKVLGIFNKSAAIFIFAMAIYLTVHLING